MDAPVRRGPLAIVAIVALAIAVAAPHVFPLSTLDRSGYDADDSFLFLWGFWWMKHAVATGQNPFWTDLLLYPHGASLALHGGFPLPLAAASLPIQWLVPGPRGAIVTYNVFVLLSFVLSGTGAYLLAARLTRNRPAALVAGVIFASAPFKWLNIPRLHVLSTEVLVWYVLAWLTFVERPTRWRALAVGLCLAVGVYMTPEYALYCVGFSLLWVVFHWRRPIVRTRAFALGAAGAAALTALLVAPLLWAEVRGIAAGTIDPTRSLDEVADWSPALLSLVTPSRLHPLYGDALSFAGEYGVPGTDGMRSETTIALTVWGLALLGLRHRRRDRSTFWVVAALVFLILLLGPFLRITGGPTTGVPLPYLAVYTLVPPLRASRDPTRLFPMALLMLSVLAAFGVRACLQSRPGALKGVLLPAALVLLVLFESLGPWPARAPVDRLVHPAYQRIARAGGDFAMVDLTADQAALLAQTRHGRPITAGSTSIPRAKAAWQLLSVETSFRRADEVLALDPVARGERLRDDRAEMKRLRLRFVVFHEGWPAQLELARQLGLDVSVDRGLVVCELPAR